MLWYNSVLHMSTLVHILFDDNHACWLIDGSTASHTAQILKNQPNSFPDLSLNAQLIYKYPRKDYVCQGCLNFRSSTPKIVSVNN